MANPKLTSSGKKPIDSNTLKSVSGGVKLGDALKEFGHAVGHGISELEDAVSGAANSVKKLEHNIVGGVEKSGQDLFENLGKAASDLGHLRIGNAAVDLAKAGEVSLEQLKTTALATITEAIDGTIELGAGVLNAGLDEVLSPLAGLGVLPISEGLVNGLATTLTNSTNAVSQLAQDAGSLVIQSTLAPVSSLSRSFSEATKGHFTGSLNALFLRQADKATDQIKDVLYDLASPTTLYGLLNAAGIAATIATFGLAAPAEAALATVGDVAVTPSILARAGGVATTVWGSLKNYLPDQITPYTTASRLGTASVTNAWTNLQKPQAPSKDAKKTQS